MSSKASSHSAGSSVAFDLGANAVRVVEIEWTGPEGNGRLVKRGSAALPVNVWNDLPANSAAFAAALRQALSSAGISAKSVAASLPRRLVTLRFARLPHAPPEQMRGLVAFEAQQYVLFPLDEVILDYHVVTDRSTGIALPAEDDMESVLLAAARRTLIIDLIAIFEKAGLELAQLTVSALALAEHIRDAIEPTALIDVEPGEMDVAVVASRQLLFTRASGLDVTGAQPDIAARRLADEVARSFTSFQNEYRQQTLTRINLTGPSVQGPEGVAVEQTLRSVLEMPISKLSSALLPPTDTDAGAYATAVGTALQTRAGSLASINLVPDERAVKKAQQSQQRRQQLAVATAFVSVALLVFFVQRTVAASAKEKAARVAANDKLRNFNDAMSARRKQFQTRKELYGELHAGLDRSHPTVAVLFALDRALPKTTDIWLTQFAFDRTGLISLHGDTKSASAATDMVLALQDSGAFTDVKLAYIGDAQETNTVANEPPAPAPSAAVAANTTPVTPLPGLPSANPTGPPNSRPGGPGGGPTGMQSPNSGSGPQTFQGPARFQPGQGFPGGLPPGVTIPPGGMPTVIRPMRTDPSGPAPAVPFPVQAIPAPPPFYLIGYGQASTATTRSGKDNAPPTDGSRGRSVDSPNGIPGVTSAGPGASNQVQPGAHTNIQAPPTKPNTVQGGPIINPAANRMGSAGVPPKVPVSKAVVAPSVRPRTTLTSFIITCRLNPQAHTLLTKSGAAPAKGGKRSQPAAANTNRAPTGDNSDSTDTTDTGGETDANP